LIVAGIDSSSTVNDLDVVADTGKVGTGSADDEEGIEEGGDIVVA
jgi:hypothetical protein